MAASSLTLRTAAAPRFTSTHGWVALPGLQAKTTVKKSEGLGDISLTRVEEPIVLP